MAEPMAGDSAMTTFPVFLMDLRNSRMPSKFLASLAAKRTVNDKIVGFDDDPLVADRRGDLLGEGLERLEGQIGAILAGRHSDPAG